MKIWTIRPQARVEAVITGGSFRITVLTSRLLRLEYEPQGHFRETATQVALCREFPVPAFTCRKTEKGLLLETEDLTVRYDGKPFSPEGLSVELKGHYADHGSRWHYGEKPWTLGGTARTLDMANGEIPLEDGLNARKGYALLDDSRSMGLDADGRLLPAQNCGVDLYFFGYGRDYKGCIRDFLHLSGAIPAVPRFALGNWWSRYYPYTQDEYMALMERFRAEGIPLSVSVLDMNWHVTDIDPRYGTGWTGYTWDRDKFPSPQTLLAWLHERGLHVTLNDHPAQGIRPCEESYERMAAALGREAEAGESFPYDASDAAYEAAFEQAVLAPLEEQGVDFWWIDWQQRGGSRVAGMDPLFCLNHTRYLHAVSSGKAPLILSRYGGTGSHRYPLGFSGDTCATWESLEFQPRFTATAANIAYTWWSHDIGGHMNGTTDPELTLRWVQFGAFSPVLRLHSSNNPFIEKEPWTFPAETAKRIIRFLRLRHQLIPWLYVQNLRCSLEGEMLLRPMYFDHPMEAAAYSHSAQEYRLGDCLIVSPITRPMDPGTRQAFSRVWLPEGIWTDFFTGWRYRGGRTLLMYRDLDAIPVLVREGGILPMDGDEVPQNGAPLPERLLIRLYPGAQGHFELVEDNGALPGQEGYESVITEVRMTCGEGLSIRILPPRGETGLIPQVRRYILEIWGVEGRVPDECSCAFRAAADPRRRCLTLELAAQALSGADLTWHEMPVAADLDWKAELTALLRGAHLSVNLKGQVMETAERNLDVAEFMAELHTLNLPDALTGAIAELRSAF